MIQLVGTSMEISASEMVYSKMMMLSMNFTGVQVRTLEIEFESALMFVLFTVYLVE